MLNSGCGEPDKKDVSGPFIDVGIFAGHGASIESVKACFAVVRSAGFTCDTLRIDEIAGSRMNRFAAVLFPAGDAHFYSDLIGPVGRSNLRNYVDGGGGYIGFGAGGAFAASDSGNWPGIRLLQGTTLYPSERIVPNPYYGMIEIERGPSPGIVARGIHYRTMYIAGPEFFPVNSVFTSVDYVYSGIGTAAAVGGEFGLGNFWITGFQPEFEEGSSRDGTTFGDDQADIDSEWELIEAALNHCITYANRL